MYTTRAWKAVGSTPGVHGDAGRPERRKKIYQKMYHNQMGLGTLLAGIPNDQLGRGERAWCRGCDVGTMPLASENNSKVII